MKCIVKHTSRSEYDHHKFLGWYHPNDVNQLVFRTSSGEGGCGMISIHHWANYNLNVNIYDEVLKYLLKCVTDSKFKNQNTSLQYVQLAVGRIICQVGDGHYKSNFTKAFELNGFTYTEAPNPMHQSTSTQRLYQWILIK
jgi:hypothetical protein